MGGTLSAFPATKGTGVGAFIRRGMIAGVAAGLLAGVLQMVSGEPLIDEALQYEAAQESAAVFSRGVQRAGLVAASALYGLVLGGILGLVYPLVAPRLRAGSTWERSMRIALAGFVTLWLVPFLKYPANPPSVGDPATIGGRTTWYLFMISVSLAATLIAMASLRRLAEQGVEAHQRQLAVGLGYLVAVGGAFALAPAVTDPARIPAELLWSFRMVSAAGQALMWTATGSAFALMTIRAERRRKGAAVAG